MEKPYFDPPNHRCIVPSSPRYTHCHRPDLPPPWPLLRPGMGARFSCGTDGSTLQGVSIAYDLFMPIMMRAVARGYVRQEHADFVADGLRFGFGLGVDVSKLRGRRLFRNYPTAVEVRALHLFLMR
eukprot:scaffold44889_cov83-Phaeocystis_antarctica.AAC.3